MVVRIALLGAGHWHAAMHADAAAAAGAQISAIWGESAAAARLAARSGAPLVASVEAALGTKPDLCVVMGHPAEVPALAAAVLAAGVPMILEKPAATSTAALRGIGAKGAFVAVPLANRLSPALRGFVSVVPPQVAHASFRIVNGPPRRYRDDGVGWVLDPAAGGGGALRNLGLHGIDCALWLARGEVRVVSAQIGKRLHQDEAVEDHAIVTLEDAAGALFTVEAGYTSPSLAAGGDLEWRVATADAYLVDRGDCAFRIGADGQHALAPLPAADRYRAFMADTLARLNDGRPPLVGLSDYVAAMEVIDRAYALAGEGRS